MKSIMLLFVALLSIVADGLVVLPAAQRLSALRASPRDEDSAVEAVVVEDEWEGFRMELTEAVKGAVLSEIEEPESKELVSVELDARIREEVARLRGKEEYEAGDLMLAMDALAKMAVGEVTGMAEFEAREIDARVKAAVNSFTGKESYEVGDLSKEIGKRVEARVAEFTGQEDYEFGDITAEIERRRREWVRDYLGEDAAEEYKFGDLTKKAVSDFTGKDEYQFGDITKKLVGKIIGGGEGVGKDRK